MTRYRGRRAASIENGTLRVTVLEEGGHIAEIRDLATDVNPLWTPHWASIEPSTYDPAQHPEYGGGADASLLAGVMGHNLCLDFFGGPSPEEAAAGLPAHGEVSVATWNINTAADAITMTTFLPHAGLRVTRGIRLDARTVHVRETVENVSRIDRPIGWTQHVTLGPPFLENGATQLDVTSDRSFVFPGQFGPADYLQPAAEFSWPRAPRSGGGIVDLRTYNDAGTSSAYTAHRLDPRHAEAHFVAFSPGARLALAYVWRREDFPWLGIWEENRSRTTAPWNSREITCGMEFGVSPVPETRQQMIERGTTFGTPGCRWIRAHQQVEVAYRAVLRPAEAIPSSIG